MMQALVMAITGKLIRLGDLVLNRFLLTGLNDEFLNRPVGVERNFVF